MYFAQSNQVLFLVFFTGLCLLYSASRNWTVLSFSFSFYCSFLLFCFRSNPPSLSRSLYPLRSLVLSIILFSLVCSLTFSLSFPLSPPSFSPLTPPSLSHYLHHSSPSLPCPSLPHPCSPPCTVPPPLNQHWTHFSTCDWYAIEMCTVLFLKPEVYYYM